MASVVNDDGIRDIVEENTMAELTNGKELISILWSGADILRSKMDANEYKYRY